MITYSTLGTNDMERSVAFYDAVLGAIDGVREISTPDWTQYGRKGEIGKICIVTPHDKNQATHGNGTMLAFQAPSRASVDAFHAAALSNGGQDAGAPDIREETHYVAYVRDPEGNKLCAFAAK